MNSEQKSRKVEKKKSKRVEIERSKGKIKNTFLLSYFDTFLLRAKRGRDG
ncbi:hypothetical protein KJ582_01065 [bacterium]|nr:hypothetical protein [bacterium]